MTTPVLPQSSLSKALLLVTLLAFLTASTVSAAPFVVPKASLQPPQVTFSEVPAGTPLNGLTINGFTFLESSPITSTAGPGAGPGNTNNINGSMALSSANPPGYFLTVIMPGAATAFGFGFALLATSVIANAVTVTLFDGAINLGSLVFAGSPDPSFTGGFAGIGNATPFTSAQVTFSSGPPAFALDNFSANRSSAVPETGGSRLMLLMGGAALLGLASMRRQRLA